jgi:hypothetical protein
MIIIYGIFRPNPTIYSRAQTQTTSRDGPLPHYEMEPPKSPSLPTFFQKKKYNQKAVAGEGAGRPAKHPPLVLPAPDDAGGGRLKPLLQTPRPHAAHSCGARPPARTRTRGHDRRRWRIRARRPPPPLRLPRPRRRRGTAGCSFRPARWRASTIPRSSTGRTCSRSSPASGASPPRCRPPGTARRTSPRASSPH